MKGKIIMSVTIGFICFILMYVVLVQFRTVEETNLTSLEELREAELRTEMASWKTKHEEISLKYQETEDKVKEYEESLSTNKETSLVLQEELEKANMLFGRTNVRGPRNIS